MIRREVGDEAAFFAELSGYTRLTEGAADDVAAQVSLTLAQLVSEVAGSHDGDGVHFHFRDPGGAVKASLEVVESVIPRGLPPAHIGVNAGPMICDEGDCLGRTVNIAAGSRQRRRRGQVFVREDVIRSVARTRA
jgi:adenylate cyclase